MIDFTIHVCSFPEEDFHGAYSKVMLKYFLAEGIVSKHSTLIASQDVNPSNIVSTSSYIYILTSFNWYIYFLQIKELPAVIDSDNVEPDNMVSKTSGGDKMRIAFRYQNLPTSDNSLDQTKYIGHNYDLSKNISLSDIENSDICYWTGQRIENGEQFMVIMKVNGVKYFWICKD